jgi:single-strand selective monofunctional uracil DNA glycosylase
MAHADLLEIARGLGAAVGRLRFGAPVAHVYNPLDYAWAAHGDYIRRFGQGRREVVLVGMNPGPWGMVQTGVPFGDVHMVRDWLGIRARVREPASQHPRRPVQGFACARQEVSGRRLWGWARAACGAPEHFFAQFFVLNYCPLCFLEASGRNLTPDRLPATYREELFGLCDAALGHSVACLTPRYVVGVGRFAAQRVAAALNPASVRVGLVPHPSPASPAANRGWDAQMEQALGGLGISVRCRDGSGTSPGASPGADRS